MEKLAKKKDTKSEKKDRSDKFVWGEGDVQITVKGKPITPSKKEKPSKSDKKARFEEGVHADPTEYMSEEDAETWWDMNEEHGDKFKSAGHVADSDGSYMSTGYLKALSDKSEELLHYIHENSDLPDWVEAKISQAANAINGVHDYFKYRGDEESDTDSYMHPTARFEEGVHADPTEYMSEEDADTWWDMNEEHGDKFKTADYEPGKVVPHKDIPQEGSEFPDAREESDKKAAGESFNLFALVLDDDSLVAAKPTLQEIMRKKLRFPEGEVVRLHAVPEILAEKLIDVGTPAQTITPQKAWDLSWHFSSVGVGSKFAATGLYGHTKSIQRSCESATKRLTKAASKMAKNIYEEDPRVADFLMKHAKRSKNIPAKILASAISDLGPKISVSDLDWEEE